jgi:iron complex outermembrane receptor protein
MTVSLHAKTKMPAFNQQNTTDNVESGRVDKRPRQPRQVLHRHPGRVRHAVAALIIACSALPTFAMAGPKIQLDIPAQDLGSALKALSAAANEQLLFSDDIVAGHRSAALKGEFTADDALAILLKGSDLKVERTKSGVLLIRPSANALSTGKSESGSNDGPGIDKAHGPLRLVQAGGQTPPASSALAASTSDNDSASVEEIVVTAQKRPELLSKAPVSISAITGAALRSEGVVNPLSISNLVPSAQVTQANGIQITIRGVSSPDGTEKGDPSAAFLLNGVYLARQQSLSGAFFDLDRVEVLRGPQGTLYGRNATAGVVNVISNRPKFDFEAAANGEVSNFDTQRAEAMANMPVTDTLAIRAAAAYNKHDSYLIDAPGDNRRLGDDQDEIATRLSGLWKFGSGQQGSLLLIGDYAHQGGGGPMPVRVQDFFTNYLTANPIYFDAGSAARRTVRYPFISQPNQDNKIYGVSGELNYDIDPIGITYLGSYRVFDRHNLQVGVFPKTPAYPDNMVSGRTHQQSHELRVSTRSGGPLDAVLGLYYFQEITDNANNVLPNYSGYSVFAFLQRLVVGDSKAVFGQATYHINDALRVTGGLRYSDDLKSRQGLTIGQQGSTVPDPALYTVLTVNDARTTSSKLTWKGGVDYDVTDKVLAYGSVATGYKAGGFNDGCSAGSPNCLVPTAQNRLFYNPEELTAYEAGLKGRYFGGILSLNLTAFFYNYTNLQLNSQQEAPAPPGQVTLNAGKAHIKGGEIEAVFVPDRLDRFDLSVALLNAKYVSYQPKIGIDYAGRNLDNSPSAVVVAGYTRTVPLPWGAKIAARAETRFSSSFLETDFNIPAQFRQPAYTTSNATLTYTAPNDRWYTEGFIKNIEDKIVFSGYGSGRVYASDPRLFGMRAGVRF